MVKTDEIFFFFASEIVVCVCTCMYFCGSQATSGIVLSSLLF